ncbi:MAG: SPFH domain-containing protein, partial [Chthoniobacterales bacterium]
MEILLGVVTGFVAFLAIYCLLGGIYTVDQNERAVVTNFGKAERIGNQTTLALPQAEVLNAEEKERYVYPQVRIVQPGGPYLRLPWQRIHKVSMSIQTINIALDPDTPEANSNAARLE